MPTIHDTPPQHLAELLMIAATRLTEPDPAAGSMVPIGGPVRRGRLYLGRPRTYFGPTEHLVLGVGFATACWISAPGTAMPGLGRLRYSTDVEVDPAAARRDRTPSNSASANSWCERSRVCSP